MSDVRWLAGAYLLVSIVWWVAANRLRARLSKTRQLSAWPQGWPGDLLRVAYYVGLPYIALISGTVPAPYLGLAGLRHLLATDPAATARLSPSHIISGLLAMVRDWLPDLLMAGSLTLGIGLLAGLAWLCLAWFTTRAPRLPAYAVSADRTAADVIGLAPVSLLRSVYQAIHWSFYRGLAWQLVGDLYLAAMLGVILVSLEWCLSPGWGSRLRHAPAAATQLLDVALLILTAGLFCYVQNVWALILVQYVLAIAVNRLISRASETCPSV